MRVEQTVTKVVPGHLRRGLSVRDNYDLLLLAVLALLLPGLLLPIPLLRMPLGLVTALFVPGYTLTAALFPRRDHPDGIMRAALSFGLSVAILPVLALGLNALPWGIRPWPIVFSLSIWILSLGSIALWRRRALSPSDAMAIPPALALPAWWRSLGSRVQLRYIVGVAAVAGALIASTIVLTAWNPTTRPTEFYLLGPAGLAEDYPRAVATRRETQARLGITNREGVTARYRVEARSDAQLVAQIGPITLTDGATWEGPLRYALPHAGDNQQVDVFLFHDDDPTPYRKLRLWIDVQPNP